MTVRKIVETWRATFPSTTPADGSPDHAPRRLRAASDISTIVGSVPAGSASQPNHRAASDSALATGDAFGGANIQVAHVEMLVHNAGPAWGGVSVDLDDARQDDEAMDARLLRRLAERSGGERRITRLAALAVMWAGAQLRETPSAWAPRC